MPTQTEWLTIDYHTLFRLGHDGRIKGENDPDRSPGPRLWLAGCAERNILGLHASLPDGLAAELERFGTLEPPFTPAAPPRHLDRYLAMLAREGFTTRGDLGLIYELARSLSYAGACADRARLVGSDDGSGTDLVSSLSVHGGGLSELGFRDPADFWSPWCAVLVADEIASIAFAARLSDVGAELGIATAKAFRGRGFAAMATAGWSRLPSLGARTLFYSTGRDNVSSQRVAARLGLQLRGASLRIA